MFILTGNIIPVFLFFMDKFANFHKKSGYDI
jgi:hypothetical protein